jgi:NADH-quinone oxidoreductase subunit G
MAPAAGDGATLIRIGNLPIYATDALVRRSPPLQRTPLAEPLAVHLHPDQASALGLAAGAMVRLRQTAGNGELGETTAPVVIDDEIPLGCARIPAGVPGSAALGPAVGRVQIDRAAD